MKEIYLGKMFQKNVISLSFFRLPQYTPYAISLFTYSS